VIVETRNQHHGATGLERCDCDIEVLAECNRVEVRAQRVVHPGEDHRDIRLQRFRRRKLAVPQVSHPGTDAGKVGVSDLTWRTEGRGQQWTEATPGTRRQRVADAYRGGITEYGQPRDATVSRIGKNRDGGKRFHGHQAMVT
jgi:hypothetical protein